MTDGIVRIREDERTLEYSVASEFFFTIPDAGGYGNEMEKQSESSSIYRNAGRTFHDIYPTDESMQALTVFQIYEGTGEWFDLSKKPIERASFSFGGAEKKTEGYYITDACIGCGSCTEVCPQNCIVADSVPHVIRQEHCLHCGNCVSVCPVSAVERR